MFSGKSKNKPMGSVLLWVACHWRLVGLLTNANKFVFTNLLLVVQSFKPIALFK